MTVIIDASDLLLYLVILTTLSTAVIIYLLRKLKGIPMAAIENLNSAVATLENVAASMVSVVDKVVANSAQAVSNDAIVQAAADKVNVIVASLQAEIAKVAPPSA